MSSPQVWDNWGWNPKNEYQDVVLGPGIDLRNQYQGKGHNGLWIIWIIWFKLEIMINHNNDPYKKKNNNEDLTNHYAT